MIDLNNIRETPKTRRLSDEMPGAAHATHIKRHLQSEAAIVITGYGRRLVTAQSSIAKAVPTPSTVHSAIATKRQIASSYACSIGKISFHLGVMQQYQQLLTSITHKT
jgi:hypothetical protein